jgi:hypothetical protein
MEAPAFQEYVPYAGANNGALKAPTLQLRPLMAYPLIHVYAELENGTKKLLLVDEEAATALLDISPVRIPTKGASNAPLMILAPPPANDLKSLVHFDSSSSQSLRFGTLRNRSDTPHHLLISFYGHNFIMLMPFC